jgi:predicted nucleic acid-binding protein
VLLKSKQEGYISVVAPLLDQLTHLGFRLSETVKTAILRFAQE